jgi:hypothetical protein
MEEDRKISRKRQSLEGIKSLQKEAAPQKKKAKKEKVDVFLLLTFLYKCIDRTDLPDDVAEEIHDFLTKSDVCSNFYK